MQRREFIMLLGGAVAEQPFSALAVPGMLILSGVVSVLFGLIVLIAPGAGALGLIWVIAAYSIVFGITFIALAFRLRKHSHDPVTA